MELEIQCKRCGKKSVVKYRPGVFDEIFFDEPRFPGSTVYHCSVCDEFTSLGGGLTVWARDSNSQFMFIVKADDFEMTFKLMSVDYKIGTYDISRFDEVMRRYRKDGCLPN